MTYQIYTEKYLIRKGISFCKLIAKERGIVPTGDKRELFTWSEAIIEWQNSHYQPVETVKETATISYDDSVTGSCEGEYCVLASGDVVRRFRTYAQAERWASASYSLVSPQEEAQAELEHELEQQIEQKVSLPETVAGDEKQDYPERPRGYTTLEVDFGETIVLFEGKELDTISRDFTLGLWWVGLESYDFYDDAFNAVVSRHQDGCYCEGDDNGRGSGRTSPQLITDRVGFFELYGEYTRLYSIAPNGCKIFLGTVFFQDYKGWSLDGNTYQPLEQIARQLML